MRRTGLSRPSFYVYFRDRHDLVLKVVEHIGGELFAMSERWYEGTGDGPALITRGDRRRGRRVRRPRPGAAGAGGRGGGGSAGGGRLHRADAALRGCDGAAHRARRSRPGGCCRWTRRRPRRAHVDDGALSAAARSGARRTRPWSRSPATLATIWSRVLYGDRSAELGLKPGAERRGAARERDCARPPTRCSAPRARGAVAREVGEVGGAAGDHPARGRRACGRRPPRPCRGRVRGRGRRGRRSRPARPGGR